MFNLFDFIAKPFGMFLYFLYQVTSNYGVAIILFSVCCTLLLYPLRLKNALNSTRTARIRPKVQAIREMFPGDTKTQTKIMEKLYQEEKVSPSMGCLTTVIPFLVLLILFRVVSRPVVNMLGLSINDAAMLDRTFRNLNPVYYENAPQYNELLLCQIIPQYASVVKTLFPDVSSNVLEGINFEFLGLNLAQNPQLNFADWESTDWSHVGLVMLPILAALSHLLPALIRSFMQTFFHKGAAVPQKKGFDFVTPMILILFCITCFQVPAAVSLYWLTTSVLNLLLNRITQKKVKNLPPEVSDLDELTAPYREAKQGT